MEDSLHPLSPEAGDEPGLMVQPQVYVMLSDSILEHAYHSRLKSNDYCLVWWEKGVDWKESLLSLFHDVIIVDLSLFGADALETLAAMKKLTPRSEIIVLTDCSDVQVAISCFRLGIADYFLKPIDPETLAWAVEKLLKRRALKLRFSTISADFELFHTAHAITMAESDSQMRTLFVRHLVQTYDAQGAVWIWDKPKFQTEIFQNNELTCQSKMRELERHFPGGIIAALAPSPDHREPWFHADLAWFPLKSEWMGGCFLFGTRQANHGIRANQIRYLSQTLEVALENQRRYSEVKQLTYVDDLTGLYNSRYLDIAVTAAIKNYQASHSGFSLLFIDIDRFKSVNDQNGHLVGSQMLVQLAAHLKRSLRKPDHLFRYGGDEFIALLYDIDTAKAFEAAERLRSEVEKTKFFIQGKSYSITLSIGLARFPEHAEEKDKILKMADDAMYNSKKNGRNQVFLAQSSHDVRKSA